MKISLVGAFNLAHGYLGAAKSLEKLGYEVSFIPAYKYKSENPKTHVDFIIKDINEQNSDIVLWWRSETLSSLEFIKINNLTKKENRKNILYSWDSPLDHELHKDLPLKCKVLDAAFVCCEDSIKFYESHGCKAYYAPPGFDPDIHYYEYDEDYICDISFVCTNLYSNKITKYPHIDRKKLIDAILKLMPDVDFRLYGPENFKEIYPNHYRGWIDFNESRKVFSNSKINLCTHIRPDGYKYINERVCQILGCKGLLVMDQVNGFNESIRIDEVALDNAYDFLPLHYDYDSYARQISKILRFRECYDQVIDGMTKKLYGEDIYCQGYYDFAKENLTWDNWAQKITYNI